MRTLNIIILCLLSNLSPIDQASAVNFPLQDYLQSITSSPLTYKKRKIAITLEKTILTENNGVGHDWNNFLSVNKQVIKKGEQIIVDLPKMSPLTIEAHAIEEDKHHPDKGKNMLVFTYSELIAITKSRFEIEITVVENGGKRAGSIAKWKYFFVIEEM